MSESTQPIHTPEFALIGSGQRSVDTYRQSLLYLYTRPKMRHLNFDHWMMTELRTYKDKKSSVKHEYLLATFTDGRDGKVHLRMERRVQDSVVKALFQRGSKTPQAGLPSSSDEAEQVGGGRPDDRGRAFMKKFAHDDVSLYPDNQLAEDEDKNRNIPVDHLAFPEGDRLNLPQMVLLACAIRQYSTTYHLTQNNCYWFCYTAAEALKTRFPEHHSLPVRGKSQQGTWLGLPAGTLFQDIKIDELLDRIDAMYNIFKKEIDETINNPDNKHTKAARKRAEEAERRIVEEMKRAAEEKKELERRGEEEMKRAAEEKKELERRGEEEQKRAEKEQKRAEKEQKRAEKEQKRAEKEQKRAEEAERLVVEEKKRAEEAERRIAELEARLASQAKVT